MNNTNAQMTKRNWGRLSGDARRDFALARWALPVRGPHHLADAGKMVPAMTGRSDPRWKP